MGFNSGLKGLTYHMFNGLLSSPIVPYGSATYPVPYSMGTRGNVVGA